MKIATIENIRTFALPFEIMKNRRLTYRPQIPQIPADSFRAGTCDTCDPWSPMNPLTGIWSTFATVPGYRDASPNGERHHLAAIVHCSLYIVHCPWSYTYGLLHNIIGHLILNTTMHQKDQQ